MKPPLLLGWHLGLGDAIICNGLVRALATEREHIYLPVKQCNRWSVMDMFSDLENVSQVVVPDSIDWKNLAMMASTLDAEYKGLGCYGIGPFDSTIFDQEFYRQAEVDFKERWLSFRLGRIKEDTKRFVECIFVHDDPSRGFEIRFRHIPDGVIVRPKLTPSIIDWVWTLRSASQIHCIDSSFALLADSFGGSTDPRFIHRYARPNAVYPTCKNGWEILT